MLHSYVTSFLSGSSDIFCGIFIWLKEVIMAVKIDQEACIGCGVCEGMYPDLFEIGPDGKAKVKSVDSYDEGLASDVASQCPVNAISVD